MRKKFLNLVFLLLVFGLTLYTVFRGEDLHAVLEAIMGAEYSYLLPAAASVVFFSLWKFKIIDSPWCFGRK